MDILQPIKKLLIKIGLEPGRKWKKVAIVSFAARMFDSVFKQSKNR